MNINREKDNPLRRKLIEILSCFLPIFPKNLQPKTDNLQPARDFTLLNPVKREFRPKRNYLTGFTLLEMLVSISVFLVVMLVASSSLLSIIDANQKAQSLKSAINNLNFALESMHKSIRVGTYYTCNGNASCLNGGTIIRFRSSRDLNGDSVVVNGFNNDYVAYRFNNSNKSIERCLEPASTCLSDSDFIKMTSDEVTIDDAKFYVIGAWAEPPSSPNPPQRVLITINGKAGTKAKTQTKFNLQTTVSQRSF